MPSLPLSYCKSPGCNQRVQAGYCAKHKPKQIENRESSTKRGYDRHWGKIRALKLTYDPFCVECNKQGRVNVATEVHHIRPLVNGGTHDASNLMSLCKKHHSQITMQNQSRIG